MGDWADATMWIVLIVTVLIYKRSLISPLHPRAMAVDLWFMRSIALLGALISEPTRR